MRIVYSGAFDEVEVPYEEDGIFKRFTAKPGEPAECPDELAAMLLEQGDIWAEPPSKTAGKTKATTPAG